MDFETWFTTTGIFQGIPIITSFVGCVLLHFICSKFIQPEKTGIRRDLRTLVLTGLLGAVGASLGFINTEFFHRSVHTFFFCVAVAFWSAGVIMPLIRLVAAVHDRSLGRATAMAGPILLSVYMLFIEPNRVEVLRGELVIPSLPRGAVIKIAHFSDLQTVWVAGREIEARDAANEFDPDIVAITGDFTASGQHGAVITQLNAWVAGLRTRTSIFVVNGDSDPHFDILPRQIRNLTYLKDSGMEVSAGGTRLWLAGVDNLARPPQPAIGLRAAPPGMTRILLTHNPDRFVRSPDQREPWHAELGLAGHTHGGQIQIPFYGAPVTFTRLGRKYSDGIFDRSRMEPEIPWGVDAFTVCAGLGMEGAFAPRVRLFRPPQVILLTIKGPAA